MTVTATVVPLADATSAETTGTALVLVPVGSIEQHGPHLPLDTDVVIADAVTHRVSELLGPSAGVIVAPPISYGASGEHQSFAGTSSIGTDALRTVLVELTRSMRTWAQRVVFVNAHGGNTPALRSAVARLLREGHDVAWVACTTETADAHAGRTETSLMLHLRPGSVRLELAEAGNVQPLAELIETMTAGGVRSVAANGVLGDPMTASALQGEQQLDTLVAEVADLVRSGVPDGKGRLRLVATSP